VIRREWRDAIAGAVLVCAMAPAARGKITIELDYSLDNNGFFLPAAQNPFGFDGNMAKAQLERAANVFSDRFVDNLGPITPRQGPFGVEFSWTPSVLHPADGSQFTLNNPAIAANVIKVYAGGRNLPGSTLGQGGPGGYGASGLDEWFDEIDGRGQAGALATPKTDFSPWGGSITFDSGTPTGGVPNWHFGATTTGLLPSKSDFYSVAVHEMAHLLGFGSADSWDALVAGGTFLGPKSIVLVGSPPTLSPDLSHWVNSTNSTVGTGGPAQETTMDPSLTTGTRKRFTLLDWAGMDDLGWDLAGPGDANADRAVNFADLVALAQNYGDSSGLARWSAGDFNEDGNVSFVDLVVLAQNYGSAAPAEAQVVGQFGSGFASDWRQARELAASGVPEPATGGLMAAFGVLLARRGTRRGSSRRGGL
jgi:hypothetical protein